jgi:N-acetylglucosamine kinase-like BadF-type ATPase
VRAALRARDRGEHSGLLDDLMAGLGARDFENFIVRLNESPAVDFAPLFPVVLAASDNGDSVANEILEHAGQELAGLAGIVIECLFGQQSISVATHGGVLASSTIVKKNFLQELKSRHPQADGFEREVDPARGALERARREFKAASA